MMGAALAYRRMGLSVIPCRRDKRPIIPWGPYQTKRASEAQIREWWTKNPNANIGIVCGSISGVDVIDCDTEEAYQLLNDDFLPESCVTATARTPHGYHVYFNYETGLTNAVRAITGTDLRTSGGYVVAPPSVNKNGGAYAWLEGLSIKEAPPGAMPTMLRDVLMQSAESSISLYTNKHIFNNKNLDARASSSSVGSNVVKMSSKCRQGVAQVVNVVKKPSMSSMSSLSPMSSPLFSAGRRDNDLFHVANALVKGYCNPEVVEVVLSMLASSCNPPFDQKEIPQKIRSALTRQEARGRNLTAEVTDMVDGSFGLISVFEICRDLDIRERKNKKHISKILARLEEEGKVEKVTKNGQYRVRDETVVPIDWVSADPSYIDLWQPLGLSDIAGIQTGNVVVYAGVKDSGKTTFLMNIAKENRHKYQVHYFTSEMSAGEFKMRAAKYKDIAVTQWHNFNLYERVRDFQDVIRPGEGNLNIIDFLEVTDQFWLISKDMQKIHEQLKGALAVIAIQKDPGRSLGRGASFSLEKARLYVTLDYGKAKIVSCKNWLEDNPLGNSPRGYECRYSIFNGSEIRKKSPGWNRAGEETE